MDGVQVDFSDMSKLIGMIGEANKTVGARMRPTLDKVTASIVADAAANAPTDQGDLRATMGVYKRTGNRNVATRWIGSPLRQAFFQELGTSAHPPQPSITPAAGRGVDTLVDELGDLGNIW